EAVTAAIAAELACAVARVGDPRLVYRVGQQEFRRGTAEAAESGQTLEHVRHGIGIIACAFEVQQADAVGLLFVLPREPALFLNGGGLGRGQGSEAGIAATTG